MKSEYSVDDALAWVDRWSSLYDPCIDQEALSLTLLAKEVHRLRDEIYSTTQNERETCALLCADVGMEFYWAHNLQAETGAHECYLRILERNKPTETKAEDSQNV